MSWIKKIFGKLSDNDEQFEEYYDENHDNVQQLEPTKAERKYIAGPNHSRDVEARMTYQYPKGNFRFPLISDGENRERPRRTQRNQEREIEKEKPREQERRQPKSRNHSSDNRKWKEENQSTPIKTKKATKVEKGNSRPFTPTEIPSPIYGFRGRPVKKEESVEYELNKFLHNEEERKEAVINQKALSIVEESLPVVEKESAFAKEPEVEAPVQSYTEEVKESSQPVEHPTHAEKIEAEEIQPYQIHETEQKGDEVTVIPTSSHECISLINEPEPVKEEPDMAVHRDTAQEEGPSLQFEAAESAKSVQEVPAGETAQPHQESAEEEGPAVDEKPVIEEEPLVEESHVDEEPEATVPSEPIKKEPERRKRSHLPFNVLMLKQDKRQMDSRKSSVRTEGSPSMERQRTTTEQAAPPVQEARVEKAAEDVGREEKPSQQTQVQGEEAVKSYSELSSSSKRTRDYVFPKVDYLTPPVSKEMSEEWLDSQRLLLDETLHNFNVRAKVVNVTQGPSVTRFEVQPEPGVKVNKITNLTDDIKLSLAAKDIRMEAPIPGKHTIGIEVPNRESRPVCISEVIASPAFQEPSSPLTAALGLDISGQPIVTDLSKMPHGLIAGATGSGKSVCINSILVSLLYKSSPDELKMLLIDPKMVELAPYNRIPHLVSPVITDVKAATAALKWAVEEMERRYELFAHTGVRDIKRFNELAKRNKQYSDMLPYLVIVIDELADLMMMSPADVEEAICRIAQKARACGIHLIIATQRPSVDVITGLIKANVPTRVAFSVSSSVDSRTIIDGSGAERLLGKGDMLFLENGSSKPVRLQGTFVSDDEIDDIIRHVREQREPDYLFQQDELIKKAQVTEEEDDLFLEACEFVVDQGGASASSLQRRFRIGYNRAARLMEMMESNGIISESRGSKPRDVLISESELETLA
ncbi:DNA translocase FtsK [Rossellomorea vietnamensis]|uniref:DNA translocase FtsK n=1 Tax=Rossellomorea vietnamensis TaxID=218284 RepID=A0ACD4C5C5_9BACI|nr:DNA translocase FtsK [Rossellomorea vietnamensis]UXH43818.1 DNA translocase FtsK [Rossellomorea vietnamensis]WQI95173.1 DNA translocase FtsK [Rossellomorea vietnamensis]